MDVKVLLKPTSSFRPVVPDLEFRSNRGYPLSLPQSLIEECYATKIVIKKRPTHQKQPGLFFKTEQSYAKPFENKMVSIGPVSLHTFTSHHQNLKDHDPFSTAAKQKMKHLWNPDVILKSGFLSKNEKLHSNQVSRTCATGTLFKNQMCATKDFCQATGAQSVSVNKGLTTGSHKPRSKSRRKRKKRSSSKLSMKNKKPKDSCVAPIKKDLSSCFPLYSANMARSDQPKLDITISRVDDCENKLPQPHLSKSAHESRTSHRMNRRNTKCTSLPPAANRPTFLQAKPSSSSEKDCGDIRTDVTSVSLFETPVRSKETNSRFLNRTTSVKLPPAPGARFSCFSSMKTDAQDENEENVTHRRKSSVYGRDLRKVISGERKAVSDANTLAGRLNLIHHYGNDYVAVTQRAAERRRKALVLQQHRARENEREAAEKQKMEQRKKIYALNRLMTSLETEKFNEFFKSLDVGSN